MKALGFVLLALVSFSTQATEDLLGSYYTDSYVNYEAPKINSRDQISERQYNAIIRNMCKGLDGAELNKCKRDRDLYTNYETQKQDLILVDVIRANTVSVEKYKNYKLQDKLRFY